MASGPPWDLILYCIAAGGDSYGGETGFIGCMRNLYIQGVEVTDVRPDSNIGNVVNGSCNLEDRFVAIIQ